MNGTERRRDSIAVSALRRYGFAAYWIIFVCWTVRAGKEPGLVVSRVLRPYPWADVLWTCGVLAIETAVLYVILRPYSFRWSWGRFGSALLLACGLLSWEVSAIGTDMPGYVYMPAAFALITTVVLLIAGLVMSTAWLARRTRRERAA